MWLMVEVVEVFRACQNFCQTSRQTLTRHFGRSILEDFSMFPLHMSRPRDLVTYIVESHQRHTLSGLDGGKTVVISQLSALHLFFYCGCDVM